jgi:drug/metabolite transporter (DMT)-like permease
VKSPPALPVVALWLIAALAILWGASWPLMKLALTEMPPLRFRAFAVGVAAAGLFAVAWASGSKIALPRGAFARIAGVTMFSAIAWSICMAYGLRLMESSRAAIIAYTFPAWSVPLSAWLLGEPITRRRAAGLALGMAGMLLLLGDELYAVGRSPLGALLLFANAACWAIGTVLMRYWRVDVPASSYTAWMNFIAWVPITLLSVCVEQGPFHPFYLSTGPMVGVLYSALVAALLCQWAWFKLVTITSASVASLSILIVPVIGVFTSMMVLGEHPRLTDLAALVMVVASLCTVMLPGRTSSAQEPSRGS